jgi:membrane protein implicated in regulation of membrane protease activity
VTANRIERILAWMVAAIVLLSLACFVAIFVAQMNGADLGTGFLAVVAMTPLLGLPVAFILIIVIMIVNARRRTRAAKDARR